MILRASIDPLLDIDTIIFNFIKDHKSGLATLQEVYLQDGNNSLIKELTEELKNECAIYLNKYDDMAGLHSYLFYATNSFYKKKAVLVSDSKKKINYLCPGCLYLGKNTHIALTFTYFKCDRCKESLDTTLDAKELAFFKAFTKHNKIGYHCQDCQRFIPHPFSNLTTVVCPYYDCSFVGSWSSLKRMHHPSSQGKDEVLIPKPSNNLEIFDDIQVHNKLNESWHDKFMLLRDVIENQKNTIVYSSADFTVVHKTLVYQAFDNLIEKYPEDMVGYLLESTRSGGFQHKVFQEYIRLLEMALPFSFKKGKVNYRIDNLLDENLNLFSGISVFEGLVNEKLEIKNGTEEFYIGGRKAAYTKPYYIGKLLSVLEKGTNCNLMNFVKEYSFSKIKMDSIRPGASVIVSHLMVPPHYQMGGMVHINRVRKKIIEESLLILNKK